MQLFIKASLKESIEAVLASYKQGEGFGLLDGYIDSIIYAALIGNSYISPWQITNYIHTTIKMLISNLPRRLNISQNYNFDITDEQAPAPGMVVIDIDFIKQLFFNKIRARIDSGILRWAEPSAKNVPEQPTNLTTSAPNLFVLANYASSVKEALLVYITNPIEILTQAIEYQTIKIDLQGYQPDPNNIAIGICKDVLQQHGLIAEQEFCFIDNTYLINTDLVFVSIDPIKNHLRAILGNPAPPAIQDIIATPATNTTRKRGNPSAASNVIDLITTDEPPENTTISTSATNRKQRSTKKTRFEQAVLTEKEQHIFYVFEKALNDIKLHEVPEQVMIVNQETLQIVSNIANAIDMGLINIAINKFATAQNFTTKMIFALCIQSILNAAESQGIRLNEPIDNPDGYPLTDESNLTYLTQRITKKIGYKENTDKIHITRRKGKNFYKFHNASELPHDVCTDRTTELDADQIIKIRNKFLVVLNDIRVDSNLDKPLYTDQTTLNAIDAIVSKGLGYDIFPLQDITSAIAKFEMLGKFNITMAMKLIIKCFEGPAKELGLTFNLSQKATEITNITISSNVMKNFFGRIKKEINKGKSAHFVQKANGEDNRNSQYFEFKSNTIADAPLNLSEPETLRNLYQVGSFFARNNAAPTSASENQPEFHGMVIRRSPNI